MFSRLLGRYAGVRRTMGLGAFLLALAGGLLAIWAAIGSGASTLIRVLQGIVGLGAIVVGRRVYRSSAGILLPRARMNLASVWCVVVGAILLFAGLGLPGILVLAAGLLGFVGAAI